MRLNKYIAQATGLSRRAADAAIAAGRVRVNNQSPQLGQDVSPTDVVTLDNAPLQATTATTIIMLNKPVGYVCSREGQGNQTVYDLLPAEYHHLKPIGRLDKNSSGLLLLTDDGQLAYELTHPKFAKTKVYQVRLDKRLQSQDQAAVEKGVELEDGMSHLQLRPTDDGWEVSMHEGRKRQIRRTFEFLGYHVTALHRTNFGPYELNALELGKFAVL